MEKNIILVVTILSVHILMWFRFGPSLVLIIRNSLVYSRQTGIWTAVGICIGNVFHIIYSILAITFVTSIPPNSYIIIKFLGAGYLVYLGIKTFLVKLQSKKSNLTKTEANTNINKWQGVTTGFITNILSIEAALFFISTFTVVISSDTPWWITIFLIIILPLISFVIATIGTIIFSHNDAKFVYKKYPGIINKFLGILFIILAIIAVFYK